MNNEPPESRYINARCTPDSVPDLWFSGKIL